MYTLQFSNGTSPMLRYLGLIHFSKNEIRSSQLKMLMIIVKTIMMAVTIIRLKIVMILKMEKHFK